MRKFKTSAHCWILYGMVFFLAVASPVFSYDDPPEQKAAIEAITKLGGKVERDETVKEKDKPVIAISFSTTQAGNDALAPVSAFPQLKKLSLNATKIDDAGLQQIKALVNLQKLYLVDTKINDAGLEQLKELSHLQILSVVGTQVTDAGLEHLKGLGELQQLFLYGTKVTDAGVKKLQEAIPKLKIDR